MDTKGTYNKWSEIYDKNENKTRDLEAVAIRCLLESYNFDNCLEIGCGTGKNTAFLLLKARKITAVDFSENMLKIAKSKINSDNVTFLNSDITKEWNFTYGKYDLAVFSLVLEHIQNLDLIFQNLSKCIETGGIVYVGELHPFKQYNGTKAKFEDQNGITSAECYTHNISEFVEAAHKNGFEIKDLKEFFDSDEKVAYPRIIALLFKKK